MKRLLAERVNEIVGLQHMKLYLFDDTILISGANLSDSYFTNRQDRYILIENSPLLADFFDSIIRAVASCSFTVDGGEIRLHHECIVHPFEGDHMAFCSLLRQRVLDAVKALPVDNIRASTSDTRIYPLLQMGVIDYNDEHRLLTRLFSSQDATMKLTLASGYFNFIDDYIRLIVDHGRFSLDVLSASPKANGFYGARGFSGYVPALYVNVSEEFRRQLIAANRENSVRCFEYSRPGWTFHAKGVWIVDSTDYVATLMGSSNYGYRSIHRDLEAQILLVTRNEKLKHRLNEERQRLFEWSQLVDSATFRQADHHVPRWLRYLARYIRNYF